MKKYTPASTFQELAEQMEQIIQTVWCVPPESIGKTTGRAKNGLTVSGLIVCKKTDCPYKKLCDISVEYLNDLPADYPCLHELMESAILFIKYSAYFEIGEGDTVDFEQISELVDVEIKLLRCNKFMSLNPLITEDGHGEKKLHSVATYELRLMEQHSRLLKSLGVFG